jgi:hypothetical protein
VRQQYFAWLSMRSVGLEIDRLEETTKLRGCDECAASNDSKRKREDMAVEGVNRSGVGLAPEMVSLEGCMSETLEYWKMEMEIAQT